MFFFFFYLIDEISQRRKKMKVYVLPKCQSNIISPRLYFIFFRHSYFMSQIKKKHS